MHARFVDAPVHADHQVERQPIRLTHLGQRPEDIVADRPSVRFGGSGAVRMNRGQRGVGPGQRNFHRSKIGRQRNGASSGPARLEMPKERRDAATQEPGVARCNAAGPLQPLTDIGLGQMENQVVGS